MAVEFQVQHSAGAGLLLAPVSFEKASTGSGKMEDVNADSQGLDNGREFYVESVSSRPCDDEVGPNQVNIW